jgi:CelD/BcsL family acetyltransferase involved in cellulose biosynthesis
MSGHAVSHDVVVTDDFDDPRLADWETIALRAPMPAVFSTRPWLRAWWAVYGRGDLLLAALVEGGHTLAVAPLFADEDGWVYFVGSGGSDYLDFVGCLDSPSPLVTMLATVRDRVPHFQGFRFYHVPDRSPTGTLLLHAAKGLGLEWVHEGAMAAPEMSMTVVDDALAKKSLRRHCASFEREGGYVATHHVNGEGIGPLLDGFFEQHVQRWAATEHPSLFTVPSHREFYRRLVAEPGAFHWLRFTTIEWQGQNVAYHLGFSFAGRFTWYKPAFDIALARRSPGEVLLRELLVRARTEDADVFDFGIGDEPFKQRFATAAPVVDTFALVPAEEAGR